jgi:hypothetical protein
MEYVAAKEEYKEYFAVTKELSLKTQEVVFLECLGSDWSLRK